MNLTTLNLCQRTTFLCDIVQSIDAALKEKGARADFGEFDVQIHTTATFASEKKFTVKITTYLKANPKGYFDITVQIYPRKGIWCQVENARESADYAMSLSLIGGRNKAYIAHNSHNSPTFLPYVLLNSLYLFGHPIS